MAVPILQCEIAPAHRRGTFVTIESICLNGGYVGIVGWLRIFFAVPNEISWRGPHIVQAALDVTLFIWTLHLLETPR